MMARKLVVQKQQQREQQQEQKSAALAASALTQAKSFERSKLIYNAKLLSPRPPA
jgi:hypothetical protein